MNFVGNIVLLLLLFFMIKRFLPVKGIKNIHVADLKIEIKNKNKQFIDVRTTGEFNRYHIPGFQNVPLNLLSKQSSTLSKEKEVIVICQSGMRSQSASKLLKKLGFEKVTNVKGGVSAWK